MKSSALPLTNNEVCFCDSASFAKLPREKRVKFGFWYKTPQTFSANSPHDGFFKVHQEWEDYCAKNFPIQFLFRNILYWKLYLAYRGIIRWIQDNVIVIISPRHRELRRAIPRHWADLDECMESFLFECVVSFVEKEKCFENADYSTRKSDRDFMSGLKRAYEYIKTERPSLMKEKEKILNSIPLSCSASNEQFYVRIIKLKSKIGTLDDKYLSWIVENRSSMWT